MYNINSINKKYLGQKVIITVDESIDNSGFISGTIQSCDIDGINVMLDDNSIKYIKFTDISFIQLSE